MIVKVIKGFGTPIPNSNIMLMFPATEIDLPRDLANEMTVQGWASTLDVNWLKTPKNYHSTIRVIRGMVA